MNKDTIKSAIIEMHKTDIEAHNDLSNKTLQLESQRDLALIEIISEYFPLCACDPTLKIESNAIRDKTTRNFSSSIIEFFDSWGSFGVGYSEWESYRDQLISNPDFIIPIKDAFTFVPGVRFGSNWSIHFNDAEDFENDKATLNTIYIVLGEWLQLMNNLELYKEMMDKMQRVYMDTMKELIFISIQDDLIKDSIRDSIETIIKETANPFEFGQDILEYFGYQDFSKDRYDRNITCQPFYVKRASTYTEVLWKPVKARPDYNPFSITKRISNEEFDNTVKNKTERFVSDVLKEIVY